MRSSGIRLGEKFVFEDKGGVWEKVADGRARCVFGSRDDYGREIDIGQDCFVYVMFDKPKPERARSYVSAVQSAGGVRVILRDDDDDSVVMEYENVSPAMVAAIAASDEMAVRIGRSKLRCVVMDMAVDVEENAMCVLVRGGEAIGGDYDGRQDDREGLAGRGARGSSVDRGRDRVGDNENGSRVSEVRVGDGAEGQDMGGVRDSGDSSDGGVFPVSGAVRVEGENLPGEGDCDGDG